MSPTLDPRTWPHLEALPKLRMVCFGVGNGSGSKLFQGFLDGHPEVVMVPGYQLMYLYPHWHQWVEDLRDNWNWPAVVEQLCRKHAVLLDSRLMPASDGLTTLGANRDQHLQLDEQTFRAFLLHLLDGRPMDAGTFLLAVHWAYAFARGEDLSLKKVLVYHLHVHEYVHYLAADFPDMQSLVFVRDPRSNLKGRYNSTAKLDVGRLDHTDGVVYSYRFFLNLWHFMVDSLERLRGLDLASVRAIRHEDMVYDLEGLMRATADFLGIAFVPILMECTFGGLSWWGDKIYDMAPSNKPNPRVASTAWVKTVDPADRALLEGVFRDYIAKYNYLPVTKESLGKSLGGFLHTAFVPTSYERALLRDYFSLSVFTRFVRNAVDEAQGKVALKDYSNSAYYRHKWYNSALRLHVQPWYKRMIVTAQRLAATGPIYRPVLHAATVVYVGVNVLRYAVSMVRMPLAICDRAMISLRFFRQNLDGTAILPESVLSYVRPPIGPDEEQP